MRHRKNGLHLRVEMVVNHHLLSRRSLERVLHLVNTVAAVEVETEHEVGVLQ